jgi:DNA-binding NtrC family response regulator
VQTTNMAIILFVDDEDSARQNYKLILEHYGHTVLLAEGVQSAELQLKAGVIDLLITDMRMGDESGLDMLRAAKRVSPETEVIVLTGHAELQNAVDAMKLGASDYLTKDTEYKEILLTVDKALDRKALIGEISRLRSQLKQTFSLATIVGASGAIEKVKDLIKRVAPSDSRVLITGESGTGKELVAQTIHTNSERSNRPFIAINCGAIPRDLQESELFGYVKGAFTGAAKDKQGLLAAADGGTVFLDEIGDTTPETQVKLLRFLEQGELQPIGATSPTKVDVRVLAATNKNLVEEIEQKRFREDLYYRLKVVSIFLPPLRERKDDIDAISRSLLVGIGKKTHKPILRLSQASLDVLVGYDWPGNIRELKNILERAAIFSDGPTIELEHLPEELFRLNQQQESDGCILSLNEVEKRYILEVLEKMGGNKLATAQHLNIATTTLYRKLRQYGIE